MKFAFVLFKYFPYGGLQRDCLSIAAACQARGHTVDVYTLSWEGDKPEGLNIHIIPVNEKRNHRKYEAFYQLISPLIHSNQYQAVVGFNKMPGLDVYYAADPCFQQKAETLRPWYYRFSARYRFFSKFEHAVFDPEINTELMMISEVEMQHFIRHYQTPAARFHMLPPGVKRDRMRPDNAGQIRAEFRAEFGFDDQQLICLMVGSDFRRKGLERSLHGLAALPDDLRQNTHLIVTGKDNPIPFKRLAKRLGVLAQLHIYAGRDDVPRFLLGADLFLHPAYSESAGNVILEAIVAGLPSLVTDVCGYSHHVTQSRAGMLAPSPFDQGEFNILMYNMLTSSQRPQWQHNGVEYGRTRDLYNLNEVAADIIEQKAQQLLS
jgi:UDP-glucose:(heptosyl)LPS alpha-1,3-glucosyltransferase